jgi:hypothetical protein
MRDMIEFPPGREPMDSCSVTYTVGRRSMSHTAIPRGTTMARSKTSGGDETVDWKSTFGPLFVDERIM